MKKSNFSNAFGKIALVGVSIISAFIFWFMVKYSQVGDLGDLLHIFNFG